MSDLICAKCGEPWENYADTAEERADLRRIARGEGCSCCGWGERCPSCNGIGGEQARGYGAKPQCPTCDDKGAILARTLLRGEERWSHGYVPNLQHVPPDRVRVLRIVERSFQCLEGYARTAWLECPDCRNKGPRCEECQGTGMLTRTPNPEAAARALMDATDEDPIEQIDAIFRNNPEAP